MSENKPEFNFLRKTWHILGLGFPFVYYFRLLDSFGDTKVLLLLFLISFFVLLLFTEILRLYFSGFETFYYKWLGFLMKEKERKQLNGTVPYFFANILVVAFLPAELAILSILFLVVGDPLAAYFGVNYGKNRFYNGKSMAGIIGFLLGSGIVGSLAIWFFSSQDPYSFLSLWRDGLRLEPLLVLWISVAAACASEFFCPTAWYGFLDDNLVIPVASGVSLGYLSHLLLGLEKPFGF